MAQQISELELGKGGARPSRLTIGWSSETNEQGGPTRWLGSWIMSEKGVEGDWFYSGHGSERTDHEVPAPAVGVRIRKWTSEGLDPEYIDLELNNQNQLWTDKFDFDTPQPHRGLPTLTAQVE